METVVEVRVAATSVAATAVVAKAVAKAEERVEGARAVGWEVAARVAETAVGTVAAVVSCQFQAT